MEPEFPASLHSPIILSVAATTRDDQLADFSNFGATSIDLGAPGVDILSTQRHFGYGYAKGTSAATPLVAATAALVLSTISKEKNSTHARGMKVKEIILLSVDLVPDLEGKTLSGKTGVTSSLHVRSHRRTIECWKSGRTCRRLSLLRRRVLCRLGSALSIAAPDSSRLACGFHRIHCTHYLLMDFSFSLSTETPSAASTQNRADLLYDANV